MWFVVRGRSGVCVWVAQHPTPEPDTPQARSVVCTLAFLRQWSDSISLSDPHAQTITTGPCVVCVPDRPSSGKHKRTEANPNPNPNPNPNAGAAASRLGLGLANSHPNKHSLTLTPTLTPNAGAAAARLGLGLGRLPPWLGRLTLTPTLTLTQAAWGQHGLARHQEPARGQGLAARGGRGADRPHLRRGRHCQGG